uniref:AMP-binding domain-containing protein n=1 Tax=Macrostomum lignano TaxID=282301 RepID=A0A1I8F9X8_9PLAT
GGLLFRLRHNCHLNYALQSDAHSAPKHHQPTVLAVEPLKFVYRGRIAVFAQPVARRRSNRFYCLLPSSAATPLPRGPHGSVETVTVRGPAVLGRGRLRPVAWLMCPGRRCDQLQLLIDDANNSDLPRHRTTIATTIRSRSSLSSRRVSDRSSTSSSSAGPTLPCLTCADRRPSMASQQRAGDTRLLSVCTDASSASDTDRRLIPPTPIDILCGAAHRAQGCLLKTSRFGVASLIRTGLQPPPHCSTTAALGVSHVAVAAAPGPDLLARTVSALCWAGCVPPLMRRLHPLPAGLAKSSQPNLRPPLPPLLELDKAKKVAEKAAASDSGDPNSKLASQTDPESAAYLDLCGAGSPQDDSLQTPGSSAPIGVRVTHRAAMAPTRCDLQLGRDLPACVDLYSGGMAFIVACLASVACGHHTLLMPAGALSLEPSASGAAGFLQMLAQRSVRDALCGYELLDRCCARLQPESVKQKQQPGQPPVPHRAGHGPAEGGTAREVRPPAGALGLSPTALRCSFGCRTLTRSPGSDLRRRQGAASGPAGPVDSDSPNAVALLQAGQPAPDAADLPRHSSVRGGDVGEILVRSRGNVEPLTAATAAAGLSARTGYLGVIRQVDSGPAPALFVIGAVADCLTGLSGCCSAGGGTSLRYYPADLEATVVRCHPAIVAVFACDSLLAVVMELSCRESDALDAVPQATTALLRDHQLVASVLIVCDPGAIRPMAGYPMLLTSKTC